MIYMVNKKKSEKKKKKKKDFIDRSSDVGVRVLKFSFVDVPKAAFRRGKG